MISVCYELTHTNTYTHADTPQVAIVLSSFTLLIDRLVCVCLYVNVCYFLQKQLMYVPIVMHLRFKLKECLAIATSIQLEAQICVVDKYQSVACDQ